MNLKTFKKSINQNALIPEFVFEELSDDVLKITSKYQMRMLQRSAVVYVHFNQSDEDELYLSDDGQIYDYLHLNDNQFHQYLTQGFIKYYLPQLRKKHFQFCIKACEDRPDLGMYVQNDDDFSANLRVFVMGMLDTDDYLYRCYDDGRALRPI